jgi:hypothetical protein
MQWETCPVLFPLPPSGRCAACQRRSRQWFQADNAEGVEIFGHAFGQGERFWLCDRHKDAMVSDLRLNETKVRERTYTGPGAVSRWLNRRNDGGTDPR